MKITGADITIVNDQITWDINIRAVDADGAAHCYSLDNKRSLDWIANAYKIASRADPDYHHHDEPGFKGWGGGALLDPNGKPVLQKSDDLAPGFLVSPTALGDSLFPPTRQRRYVDSTAVPYISAPKIFLRAVVDGGLGCKLGDLGLAALDQHAIPFIWADVGPGLGEVSIRLAEFLGVPSSPKTGGSKDVVHFTLYRGSRSAAGWPRDLDEMAAAVVALAATRPV